MESNFLYVKRYAHGKATVTCRANPVFQGSITEALAHCLNIEATFLLQCLERNLKELGMPEDEIDECLRSVTLNDETYLRPD